MIKEELTKENAIFLLKQVNEILINNNSWLESTHEPLNQAFDMAIKALEQQGNTWSLDDAREDFMHDVYNTLDFLPTNNEANRIIDSFDRVTSNIEQQPSDDCVSRKELIAYLTSTVGLSDEDMEKVLMAINDMPPVAPTQSWIPLVWDEYPTVDSDGNDDYVYAVDYSVPMPKDDEWVLVTDENHNVVKVQYDGYDFGDYARENILAWQPLPKAYEE